MAEEKGATNLVIRSAYDTIGEIMGENGRKMIFINAGLARVIENPPAYDFERAFLAEEQVRIYQEIVKLVGEVGCQGILRQIGYRNADIVVNQFHLLDHLKNQKPEEKIVAGFEFVQNVSGKGKVTIDEHGMPMLDIFDCLFCEGVKTKKPYCSPYAGALQCMADFAFGKGKYLVAEEKCIGMGDSTCLCVLKEKR